MHQLGRIQRMISDVGNRGVVGQTLWVDGNASNPIGPNDQDGSFLRQFSTIDKAAKASPKDPSGDTVNNIVIASAIYPEDGELNIDITEKRINLYSMSRWSLGSQTQQVNLVVSGNYTQGVLNDTTGFSIQVFEQGTPAKGGTFSLPLVPRIFGKIDYIATGSSGLLRGVLNVDVNGDVSGDSITALSGSKIGIALNRCEMSGRITGDSIDLQDCWDVEFEGVVSIDRIRRAKFCRFRDNWTVLRGPIADRVAGFRDCVFDPGLTWTGPAASLFVDAATNWSAKDGLNAGANPLTLAGGATAVLMHDATVIT